MFKTNLFIFCESNIKFLVFCFIHSLRDGVYIHICVNASQGLTVKSNPRKVTPSTLGIVGGGAVKCILLPTLTRLKTPSR